MTQRAKQIGRVSPPNSTGKSRASVRRTSRVLLEFPSGLLERADRAAAEIATTRSELVRTAVEQLVSGMEKQRLERELAEAYAANASMNLKLAREFEHVDREGF